jgi:hypothetical protein
MFSRCYRCSLSRKDVLSRFEGKDARMRIDRPAVVVCNLSPVRRWMEAPVQGSEPHLKTCDHAVELRPLDWDMVVRAAAARLNDTFGVPDPMDDPLVVGLAQALAPLLCAYGRAAQEVDRMEATATEPPFSRGCS